MKAYDESMYWMRNDDWFTINHERDCFELTDAAPQRAIESFRLYLIRNDMPVDQFLRTSDDGRTCVRA